MKQLRFAISIVLTLFAFASHAQDAKTDSNAFSLCSKQTNQLYHQNLGLDRFHNTVDAHNLGHDELRVRLDRREATVQMVDQRMKENPADKRLWKQYDLAFLSYEQVMGEMRKWNTKGERLGWSYQSAIDRVVALQKEIAENCGGKWELAIIHKFCDNSSGQHREFCKAFEQ